MYFPWYFLMFCGGVADFYAQFTPLLARITYAVKTNLRFFLQKRDYVCTRKRPKSIF